MRQQVRLRDHIDGFCFHVIFGLKMKNVTLTPHSAWLTTQSMDKLLFAGLNLLKKHIEQS